MDNARNCPCEIIYNPTEGKYIDEHRDFQGCPTIAITKKGRIFAGWYAGGYREPHMDNFNLLVYSDDDGKTWTKPIVVIPSSKEKLVHALDIQLWTAPNGKLYMFWVQNNVLIDDGTIKADITFVADGEYVFNDFEHAEWYCVCDNPNAEKIVFSSPKYMDKGFLRCKPTVLNNGKWLFFNYDQNSDRYGYSVSEDGENFAHFYGAKKLKTPFDEAMAYQKKDGSVRMFARTALGKIAESTSYDNGTTWNDAFLNDINNANTRFFVSRTPSGRVMLVNNDDSKERKNMTVYLSDDDGETWKYKRVIDSRTNLSYPDVDFYNGCIYLTYDFERTGANEILFAKFTEEDIMNDKYEFKVNIICKR